MNIRNLWRWRKPVSYLARPIDSGRGQTVVLLHGIGRSGDVWHHLVDALSQRPFRLVAFDLLGFGASPKPQDKDYDIDDHADAVITSMTQLKLKYPVIMVGHSLGALVAVRVARLRPDLVRHLILYEMPLYEGLPEKRRYRARLKVYFSFYNWAINQHPNFAVDKRRFRERVASRLMDMELSQATWQPLIKTVRNSIMHQTAADDIKHLSMPSDVIYGSRDMFVIRGKVTQTFGADKPDVTSHIIAERHLVTAKSSKFLAERIVASTQRPKVRL